MHRRSLLKGTAAGAVLSVPALAQGTARTLRFIPQIDLAFLDPHWTTANVTRNHGYMVFDTLYGLDENDVAHPQMAEGHRVEEDGRRWTIRLREGLLFHDGTPVLARDCVASIRRWGARRRLRRRADAGDRRDLRARRPHHRLPPEAALPAAAGRARQARRR